ncbi:MAG: hypothetical protein ABIY52_01640 [Gemmatimonadaceae bacterium]
MFRRSITALSLIALSAAPLAAQMKDHDMKGHDPDNKVVGGKLPTGWMGRADKGGKVEETKFAAMGKGWHVTTGPAAIYWSGAQKAAGPFTASATFQQTKAPSHPEAYGMIFQGNNLSADNVSYAYFLVRGDGKFMVNHRAGGDVHKIVEWTDNAAIKKQDAKGVATNTLTVDASRPDSVRLKVNGVQVHALDVAHFGNVAGNVGLRVNHNLDVHVSDFVVTPRK